MRVRLLLAAVVFVVAATPAAAPARGVAGWPPALFIRGDGANSYQVVIAHVDRRMAWIERADVYVPRGFTLDTRPGPGTKIGRAWVVAHPKSFHQDLVVASAADSPPPACTATPQDALWKLTAGPELADRDVYVAVARAVGATARFASFVLTVCPAADTKPGLIQFQIDDVIGSPRTRGDYVWRAVFHPASDPAGAATSVETRVLVRLPVQVSLRARRFAAGKRQRVRRVHLTGRVLEGGALPVGLTNRYGTTYGVELLRGQVPSTESGAMDWLGVLVIDPKGRFAATVRDRGGRFYRVRTGDRSTDARPAPPGICGGVALAPGGCQRATMWDFFVWSAIVRAR